MRRGRRSEGDGGAGGGGKVGCLKKGVLKVVYWSEMEEVEEEGEAKMNTR